MSIVIDPGHGGSEPRGKSTPYGGRARSGAPEKELNWALATEVARRLGPGAMLTRSGDENRSLRERIEVARRYGANVFVSLHAHDHDGPSEIWVHDRASPASLRLASALGTRLGGAPVQRAELAVLDPASHDGGTAACLIESRPYENLDAMAAQIASAIRAYGHGPMAAGQSTIARGQGWFGDLANSFVDAVRTATDPIALIFSGVVTTNIAVATELAIPQDFTDALERYINDASTSTLDSATLRAAQLRSAHCYEGGWILDIQTGAAAMTLDRAIFFRSGRFEVARYIHELVHVGQYAVLGPTAFLISYFGLSAAEIARRFVNGEPIEPMRSSPHEEQAYELENRFRAFMGLPLR